MALDRAATSMLARTTVPRPMTAQYRYTFWLTWPVSAQARLERAWDEGEMGQEKELLVRSTT